VCCFWLGFGYPLLSLGVPPPGSRLRVLLVRWPGLWVLLVFSPFALFGGGFSWLFVFLLACGSLSLLASSFRLASRPSLLLRASVAFSGFGPGVGFVRAPCAWRRRFSSWRLLGVGPSGPARSFPGCFLVPGPLVPSGCLPVWALVLVALGRPLGRPCLLPCVLRSPVYVRPGSRVVAAFFPLPALWWSLWVLLVLWRLLRRLLLPLRLPLLLSLLGFLPFLRLLLRFLPFLRFPWLRAFLRPLPWFLGRRRWLLRPSFLFLGVAAWSFRTRVLSVLVRVRRVSGLLGVVRSRVCRALWSVSPVASLAVRALLRLVPFWLRCSRFAPLGFRSLWLVLLGLVAPWLVGTSVPSPLWPLLVPLALAVGPRLPSPASRPALVGPSGPSSVPPFWEGPGRTLRLNS